MMLKIVFYYLYAKINLLKNCKINLQVYILAYLENTPNRDESDNDDNDSLKIGYNLTIAQ